MDVRMNVQYAKGSKIPHLGGCFNQYGKWMKFDVLLLGISYFFLC